MASKLNDTKRTILAGAASRTDLKVLPVPETIKVSEAMVDKMLRELLGAGLVAEAAALKHDVVWREADDVSTLTLVATDAGLAAIGVEPGIAPTEPTPPPSTASKQDAVVGLLRRQQGASIEEMMAATGWQSHSVRGFLSGTLKKLELELISEKDAAGVRRYYVAPIKSAEA